MSRRAHSEYVLIGRAGALTRHAQGTGPETTAAARAKSPVSRAYWDRVVDPAGTLDPRERALRADRAYRAEQARRAARSVAARRKRAAAPA
jgi:hypothetical protein